MQGRDRSRRAGATSAHRTRTRRWLALSCAALLASLVVAPGASATGDRLADYVIQNPNDGSWSVARSGGTAFQNASTWLTGWAAGTHYRLLSGDFNGDRHADVLAQSPVDGSWGVQRSDGSRFTAAQTWLTGWAAATHYRLMTGDFNGDGYDDILAQSPVDGSWGVQLSDSSRFTNGSNWATNWAVGTHYRPMVGDFNGDGRDDILAQSPVDGSWGVMVSNGTRFTNAATWATGWAASSHYRLLVGDYNGDGRDDILAQSSVDGSWGVMVSDGTRFTNAATWAIQWAATNDRLATGDFNGDCKSDVIAHDPNTGIVRVMTSRGSSFNNVATWATGWGGASYYRELVLRAPRYLTSVQYGGGNCQVDTEAEKQALGADMTAADDARLTELYQRLAPADVDTMTAWRGSQDDWSNGYATFDDSDIVETYEGAASLRTHWGWFHFKRTYSDARALTKQRLFEDTADVQSAMAAAFGLWDVPMAFTSAVMALGSARIARSIERARTDADGAGIRIEGGLRCRDVRFAPDPCWPALWIKPLT